MFLIKLVVSNLLSAFLMGRSKTLAGSFSADDKDHGVGCFRGEGEFLSEHKCALMHSGSKQPCWTSSIIRVGFEAETRLEVLRLVALIKRAAD